MRTCEKILATPLKYVFTKDNGLIAALRKQSKHLTVYFCCCIMHFNNLNICNQVKPLLLNKAKTFLHKKQIHFSFTDIFPNINRLLRIAYNEREKSTALKDWQSWRVLMNIHYESPLTTMLWFSFLRKDTEECFLLIPSLSKHKIENR